MNFTVPLSDMIDSAHPAAFVSGWRMQLVQTDLLGMKRMFDSLNILDSYHQRLTHCFSSTEQVHRHLFFAVLDRVLHDTNAHYRVHRSITSSLFHDISVAHQEGSNPVHVVYYFSGDALQLFQTAILETQGYPPILDTQKNPTAVHIRPSTGTILPWQAFRPHYGLIVNHAIPLTLHELDKTRFLSHFRSTVFDPKLLRNFQDGFPKLPSGSSCKYLLAYYSKIVQYCCLYGVYVPPLYTLIPDNIMGSWYPDLPAVTQDFIATTFPSLLLNFLLNSKTNLHNNDEFGVLLRYAQNGYGLLYNLAVIGGHPTLLDHPYTSTLPHQQDTDTIADYLVSWQHFIYLRVLSGVYISDRYFLLQFTKGLHRGFSILSQYLDNTMAPFNDPQLINDPILSALTPE